MLEPIGAIVDAILASPAPVVMPDTTSMLNIIETSIHDERVSANIIPAVLSFLSRLQATPSSLHLVLSHVVEQEWLRHHESTKKRAVASIRHVDQGISYLFGIAANMRSAPAEPYIQFSGLQIAQRLHSVAEQVIGLARVIANEEKFQSAMGIRTVSCGAPASPNRPEPNDCLLIEQYLELCRRLRAAGFRQRCIFVTSNTRDFGEPKAPRPPLDREFLDAEIDFVYDFASAAALI